MYDFNRMLAAGAVLLLAWTASGPTEARAQAHVFDDKFRTFLLFDQFEYVPGVEEEPIGLEATGWAGGDLNRLWVRAEGEQATRANSGEAELEAFYGRLVSPFFDVVGGARLDTRWGAGGDVRGHLAVGLQGLAPYRFEVEPTLYVSHEGDVSARFEAAYHFLFTQRLILESEVEADAAVQSVPDWGVGTGANALGLGLRLRYEIRRKVAPYVGYAHDWRFGETADFARADGESPGGGAFVFGVRLWR